MAQRSQSIISIAFPNQEEARLVREAAKRQGLTVSAWLRAVVLERAERVIKLVPSVRRSSSRRPNLRIVK